MFIKCPCTWDHEYPGMHGLSSIVASRFRCKLKNLEFQTNGGSLTWYVPTATPLTPYFNPLHQPKTPVFTNKLSPKVLFFHTVQNFGNCSLKDPKSAGKKVTKCPSIFKLFLWLLSLKDPQFFALHACKCLRGMLLPQTQSEAGKFCILETESCNLVNTFRCKFNEGDENKISVLQAQPTQLLWKNFIGGQGWYTGHHTLAKHGQGIYPTTILCMILPPPGSLNKCQVYLKLCQQRHFKCQVQCRASWRARENFEI